MKNQELKNKIKHEIICTLLLLVSVTASFVSIWVFVMPSDFAPSGIDGVSMILNEITDINPGWFKLAINIPLMILAWIFLKRRYVLYIIAFTIIDSLGLVLLEKINFYQYIPTDIGGRLIASLSAGVALGFCVGLMIKIGASSGGIDIIAGIVNLKKPHIKIERIISFICYVIIFCSYFVYWDLNSVLLSLLQIVVFEVTSSFMLKNTRYAVEVKIVTKEPEKIREEILFKLNHSATVVESKGMYTGEKNYVVMTVINSIDIHNFMQVMKQHPESFVYFSDGVRVQGDFHYHSERSSLIKSNIKK